MVTQAGWQEMFRWRHGLARVSCVCERRRRQPRPRFDPLNMTGVAALSAGSNGQHPMGEAFPPGLWHDQSRLQKRPSIQP